MNDQILPIWKPFNLTSFYIVKSVRKYFYNVKVGHAGTLDPFAQGVLMVCTGKKTKSVEYWMNQEKEYIAEIYLGAETDTLDPTGNIVLSSDVPQLSKIMIVNVLKKYIGVIEQEPPMYSAIKINGERLYKLARKGITVTRKKRPINIYDIQLISFKSNSIRMVVRCGRGTYIRVLAKDIANSLGTHGYLKSLTRTRVGEYDKDSCISIKEVPSWLSVK